MPKQRKSNHPVQQKVQANPKVDSQLAHDASSAETASLQALTDDNALNLRRHAALLNRSALTPIQRQAIARHIGRIGGNQYLSSVMRQVQRHSAVPLEYEENSVSALRIQRHVSAEHDEQLQTQRIIQRHSSVGLEYEENSIQPQRLPLQREQRANTNYIDRINDALEATPMSTYRVLRAIDSATDDTDRAAAAADPRLRDKIITKISGRSRLRAFQKMKAPLRVLLEVALTLNYGSWWMEHLITHETNADNKREVLENFSLMENVTNKMSSLRTFRALKHLGAPVAECLRYASGRRSRDRQEIIDMVTGLTADEKALLLREYALIEQLTSKLPIRTMMEILILLNASVTDRLELLARMRSISSRSVDVVMDTITVAQAQEVANNADLIERLTSKLSRSKAIEVMTTLGVSLANRLRIAIRGRGRDMRAMESMITSASQDERMAVYGDSGLMAELEADMSARQFRKIQRLIRFGSQAAVDAATDEQLNDTTLPDNLTAKISAELGKETTNAAKILADINAATAADKALVRGNASIMGQMEVSLTSAEFLSVSQALGDSIINQLNLMLEQGRDGNALMQVVRAANAADRQSLRDNTRVTRLVMAQLTPAQTNEFMTLIGDSIANRIRQAILLGQTAAQINTLITSATADERAAMKNDSTILSPMQGAYNAMEFWQMRLLMQYGAAASYPAPLTALIAAWTADSSFAGIQRSLANMSTADFTLIKGVIGIREVLRSLVAAPNDYTTILRMLDQGFLGEQTDVTGAVPETLQTGPTTSPFVPQAFAGTKGYDVAYLRDRLQVDIRININPADARARRDKGKYTRTWESIIENAWDNRYRLRNANHTLPIRINCQFTSNDPHHTVNVGSQLTPTWPAYNEFNWFYRATNYSAMAPIHEFGHMLGNKDEYMLSAADFTATVGSAPTAANSTSETDSAGTKRYETSSVMGTNAGATGGSVEKRHLNDFTNWLNANRRKKADGTFYEPAFTLI